MSENGWPVGPSEATWLADQQRWAKGWRRVVFPVVLLGWLIEVATAIPQYSHGIALAAGFFILAAFCVGYLLALPAGSWCSDDRYLRLTALLGVLFFAELPFARADAFIMAVFVAVLAVMRFGERALVVPLCFTALAVLLPPAVPSWHDSFATALDNGSALAIPLTGLAMLGFHRIVRANLALANARSELAQLAAENERTRIARDLHDLLGHSLTTITVKAELASRLARDDLDGAIREIGEVAALGRRALSDVRAAVSNYREVTLTGELATGRELLRAAGIAAELPPAIDVTDEATQELFGWVVREGLTNVVRHSHASTCRVTISARSVEIADDGIGTPGSCGNGLNGLAERVSSAGGVIEVGPAQPSGWRLAVRLRPLLPS